MRPLLALVGPTAGGKSAVALALARRLAAECPVEIISVDSALVYRGMDIGTAKPSASERQEVVHHLIDIREPTQTYSAAEFVRDVEAAAAAARSRGALPLLVGGTMMYVRALREGLHALPPAHAPTRAALDLEAAQRGWPALHAELAAVDPVTAARLHPTDSQRIQRALEVWRTTRRSLSDFLEQAREPAGAAHELRLLSLEPASRAWLHERIALRFDAMLGEGLLDEVVALRARGDLHLGMPSMRCVGYRQAWEALETGELKALRERGIAATRQLAKRQLTWLRSMPDRTVFTCEDPRVAEQALDWVRMQMKR